MSLNLNSKPGSDLEGDARQSEELQIAQRVPQVKIRPMPVMSDSELYLRLGVPDGLQVSSDRPTKIDFSAQDEAAHGQSSIKSDSGA
jgi:hypothetical protein